MNSLLFPIVGAVVMVVFAFRQNAMVHNVLKKHTSASSFLTKAISMLVVMTQLPELIKMLEHASLVHVTGSLFLLAILVATKSGTEGELH